jgi:hypothetical protein
LESILRFLSDLVLLLLNTDRFQQFEDFSQFVLRPNTDHFQQ